MAPVPRSCGYALKNRLFFGTREKRERAIIPPHTPTYLESLLLTLKFYLKKQQVLFFVEERKEQPHPCLLGEPVTEGACTKNPELYLEKNTPFLV
jgi:hypothetical protein